MGGRSGSSGIHRNHCRTDNENIGDRSRTELLGSTERRIHKLFAEHSGYQHIRLAVLVGECV